MKEHWYPPSPQDVAGLPPVLKGIVCALGWKRSNEFLSDHGGTVITLPQHHTEVLGLTDEELKRLRTELARHIIDPKAARITVPKRDKLFILQRNWLIRQKYRTASLNELAREFKLTTRHILNIVGQDSEYELQPNLFD